MRGGNLGFGLFMVLRGAAKAFDDGKGRGRTTANIEKLFEALADIEDENSEGHDACHEEDGHLRILILRRPLLRWIQKTAFVVARRKKKNLSFCLVCVGLLLLL